MLLGSNGALYDLTFRTDDYSYMPSLETRSVSVSDDSAGVGPEIQIGYNVIDYSLTNQVSWHQAGRSAALLTYRYQDDDTAVKAGLYVGLSVHYPLTSNGRVFLEAHGSYRWVDATDASAGIASVEIDPSSWEGGVGVGLLFDNMFGEARQ